MVTMMVLLLLSSSAIAGPKASAFAQDADRLFKGKKFKEAAQKLEQAYEDEPSGLFLYGIARAYQEAGENQKAVEYFKKYIELPVAEQDSEPLKKAKLAVETNTQRANLWRMAFYATGGLAVVSLGTSLGFAFATRANRSRFTDAGSLKDKQRAQAATKTTAVVTDVTLLIGAAAAVASVALLPKYLEPHTSVSIAIVPLSGGAAMGFGGTF